MMLPESSTGRRWFELSGQLLVLYSIVVFYMEAELGVEERSRLTSGFWYWNERVILVLFSAEYLYRWSHAQDRLRYPFTLLAAIDMIALLPSLVGLTVSLRSLKLLRILPLLWMFKLYRYNDALQRVLRGFRRVQQELTLVSFVATIVMLASSVAMHEFEHEAQPEKFGQLGDSMWWAFVTLTTVGYGDVYPVTAAGRLVAVITMLIGIGVLGTFLSLVGSSFLETIRTSTPPLEEGSDGVPSLAMSRPGELWPTRRAG